VKAHYRTANGRVVFELEGACQADVFRGIADLQEIFEGESACGMCHKTNIRFMVRDTKTKAGKPISYFEMRCLDCGARFEFGQSQVKPGNLFPKRKNPDTNRWLPNNGWSKYVPKED
jgi:hypothetical protein